MKYRAEVICDKCGARYVTIKLKHKKPVRCKYPLCGSTMIRVIRVWAVERDPDTDDMQQYTTKQLRYLLAMSSCKGPRRELVLKELSRRPDPPKRPAGRPKGAKNKTGRKKIQVIEE